MDAEPDGRSLTGVDTGLGSADGGVGYRGRRGWGVVPLTEGCRGRGCRGRGGSSYRGRGVSLGRGGAPGGVRGGSTTDGGTTVEAEVLTVGVSDVFEVGVEGVVPDQRESLRRR